MPPDFSFIPKFLLALLAAFMLVIFGVGIYCGIVVFLWIIGAIAAVIGLTIIILIAAPLLKSRRKKPMN